MRASPANGQTEQPPRFKDHTMHYQAANLRNAFVAVAFAFLASAIFMAGAVGPAIA
jgi:hypothetical protein